MPTKTELKFLDFLSHLVLIYIWTIVPFQMAGFSAYFGALLLLYCCFYSVHCSCDCDATYNQCFSICLDPNACTACATEKEKCESNCSSGKRSSEDWKPTEHAKSMLITPDQYTHHLPLSHSRDQTLKYLLRDILARREKDRLH